MKIKKGPTKSISLIEAISIGIGGMVGGGIFAVLGLAIFFAKGGTPFAFLISGILAMLTAYSYYKLSLAYPNAGGTVHFMNIGFGKNIFSGSINNLLWISYIIMLSLYSTAFGSYAGNLFSITGNVNIDQHIFICTIIIIATAINYFSVKVVGETEKYVVGLKVVILTLFVVIGGWGLMQSSYQMQLLPEYYSSATKLIAGGFVIFVAYEGFELIANTSPYIQNPQKNIRLAYMVAVVFVIVLYVSIAIITVGSLSFSMISESQDYVLAEAAKPYLGQTGFVIITIAALLSTFSAINATIYGGSRVNYEMAEDDELPQEFTRMFWKQPVGLIVTSVLTLIIANTFDLESIATTGSIGFLLIFAMVNFVSARKSREINSSKFISYLGFGLCLIAAIIMVSEQLNRNLTGTLIALGIVTFAFVAEVIYRLVFFKR
jgi:amino acid transporter